MKYFRWSESEILNMTYEKFTMYLSSIPDYSSDKDEEETKGSIPEATGSFNMFDFGQK